MHIPINRTAAARAAAVVWLILVTLLVKVDGQEGAYPLFRVLLLGALPIACLYIVRRGLRGPRLTPKQWWMAGVMVFLLLYPCLTMLFGTLSERNLKDAAYTLAIYLVIFAGLKTVFVDSSGKLDIQACGRAWVAFALVEAIAALALRAGIALPLGSAVFIQQPTLDGRLHGLVGTPSHLAPIVGIGGLFLISQRASVWSTAALLVLSVALVMTGSRSALLAFAVAIAAYAVVRAPGRCMSAGRVFQFAGVTMMAALIGLYFADRAVDVLEMATRVDPPNWEKNRFVMWSARLAELVERGPVEQLVGSGHRAVEQTFNMNVEFLVNYGILYLFAFNLFYFEVVFRLFLHATVMRDRGTTFLMMTAVFCYVFSQGLNFALHQFVTAIHVALAAVLIGYFDGAVRFRLARSLELGSMDDALHGLPGVKGAVPGIRLP